MIMLGALAAKTGITSLKSLMKGLTEIVKGKKSSLMKLNQKALDEGAAYATKGATQ